MQISQFNSSRWLLLLFMALTCALVKADAPPLDAGADPLGFEAPKPEALKPLEPGYHKSVIARHDGEITYSLFLPDDYTEAKHPLPLLVLQNPGGSPNIKRYMDWAKERQVIIVGIHKVSNGMKQHFKPRYQDGVLKDLAARNIPIHDHLKITIGMSGGSADGERFARRRPKDFAGTILQGAGNPTTRSGSDHFCTAMLFGTRDSWVNVAKVRERTETARKRGQHIMLKFYPGMKHEWAPKSDQLDALDWVLDMARLTNPYLSDEEKKVYRNEYTHQMKAIAKVEDINKRINSAASLLRLKPLANEHSFTELQKQWVEDVIARSKNEQDKLIAHQQLMDALASTAGELLPDELQDELVNAAKSLRQDAQVNKDWELCQAYRHLEQQEINANEDKEALHEVGRAYDELLPKAVDTRWEEPIKQSIKRVGYQENK